MSAFCRFEHVNGVRVGARANVLVSVLALLGPENQLSQDFFLSGASSSPRSL